MSGLRQPQNKPIQFYFVVNIFGVKYRGKENAQHLKQILEQYYEVLTEWSRSKHVRLFLKWDYGNREVHILMSGYVQKALTRFEHILP